MAAIRHCTSPIMHLIPPPSQKKKKKIAEELFSVSLGRLYYTRKMKNKGYAKLGGKYGELRGCASGE